jgi:prepilin-type N-terminal cleavage/methylation domain-containing protein
MKPVRMQAKGYTLIEVICVLILLGILAAYAGSKYTSKSPVSVRSAADILVADIRYAQALAVRRNANIEFIINSNGYRISGVDGDIKTVIFGAGEYAALFGITLSEDSFIFDGSGTPNIAVDLEIHVQKGGDAKIVNVTIETGRVGIE